MKLLLALLLIGMSFAMQGQEIDLSRYSNKAEYQAVLVHTLESNYQDLQENFQKTGTSKLKKRPKRKHKNHTYHPPTVALSKSEYHNLIAEQTNPKRQKETIKSN